jgi:hypothetical protein
MEGCGLTTERQEMTPASIRIDVWRGIKALLLTLVIPVTMAVFVDVTTGLLPWLTIAAAIICIPLATIIVNRTVLTELDRVVALVAPQEVVETTETPEEPAPDMVENTGTDFITNDRSLDGQLLTEGAQKHHG